MIRFFCGQMNDLKFKQKVKEERINEKNIKNIDSNECDYCYDRVWFNCTNTD